jgi:hypothetical protein
MLRGMAKRSALVIGLLMTLIEMVNAETVTVKYRGDVPLETFQCENIDRSSLVRRVCYDAAQEYMVILLKGTYYHYCEIDQGTVDGLLAADSMGRYFQANIRGSGSDGPFDCRTHRVPEY